MSSTEELKKMEELEKMIAQLKKENEDAMKKNAELEKKNVALKKEVKEVKFSMNYPQTGDQYSKKCGMLDHLLQRNANETLSQLQTIFFILFELICIVLKHLDSVHKWQRNGKDVKYFVEGKEIDTGFAKMINGLKRFVIENEKYWEENHLKEKGASTESSDEKTKQNPKSNKYAKKFVKSEKNDKSEKSDEEKKSGEKTNRFNKSYKPRNKYFDKRKDREDKTEREVVKNVEDKTEREVVDKNGSGFTGF